MRDDPLPIGKLESRDRDNRRPTISGNGPHEYRLACLFLQRPSPDVSDAIVRNETRLQLGRES